ncbi:hypothetical protein AAFF_G00221730 [Aldrovandia affinis]|uniref:Uncharacterized protein n=1 Tax=Aldrovandia affinis TaxID=143900 RepID=A0AAD7RFT6_9TELE|nr:hypothetical protein AAFF_G00221730 [Aldrovandia affinis]
MTPYPKSFRLRGGLQSRGVGLLFGVPTRPGTRPRAMRRGGERHRPRRVRWTHKNQRVGPLYDITVPTRSLWNRPRPVGLTTEEKRAPADVASRGSAAPASGRATAQRWREISPDRLAGEAAVSVALAQERAPVAVGLF